MTETTLFHFAIGKYIASRLIRFTCLDHPKCSKAAEWKRQSKREPLRQAEGSQIGNRKGNHLADALLIVSWNKDLQRGF